MYQHQGKEERIKVPLWAHSLPPNIQCMVGHIKDGLYQCISKVLLNTVEGIGYMQ